MPSSLKRANKYFLPGYFLLTSSDILTRYHVFDQTKRCKSDKRDKGTLGDREDRENWPTLICNTELFYVTFFQGWEVLLCVQHVGHICPEDLKPLHHKASLLSPSTF